VKLAYLPSASGVTLRITATGSDEGDVESKVRELTRYLESVAGSYIYGRDSDSLESVVGQLLKDNDKTLAVAESCTGGQLGMLITSAAGASSYFLGGLIAYANEIKIDKLGVASEIIEQHGAVSEQCAEAMAVGCRNLFGADYALSITGTAGPEGGTETKPIGTTFVGLASVHGNRTYEYHFASTREFNRTRAAHAALELLRRDILDIT